MTRTKQTNVRLSTLTRQQLAALCRVTGQSEANVISMAIDRLFTSPDMDIDRWRAMAEPHAETEPMIAHYAAQEANNGQE